jgi:hypothetical protein
MDPIEARVRRSYYVRLAIIGALTAGIGWLLMGLEYRQWARQLDREGVTRRDGKRYAWADLKEVRCVEMRLSSGRPVGLNHVELHFNKGKAKIFPLMLENSLEVMRFVRHLPGADELGTYGY